MKLIFTPIRSIVKQYMAPIKRNACKCFAIFLLAFVSAQSLRAQLVYAISSSDNLISFNASAPAAILSTLPLTGITTGQVVEGLDFRPATGQLYALGYKASNGQTQLYTIKTTTGVATPVGVALTLAAGMTDLSFDFNPTVDRIRLASRTRQNYRLNPNDGTLAATDGTLTYAPSPEQYAASIPQVVAVAYTNNFAGAATTTLYNYDFGLNILGIINPPNNGTVNSIGTSSGGGANNTIGLDLDISTNQSTGVNTAYLSADLTGTSNGFFTINLATGSATFIGNIGGGKIIEMAVSLIAPIPGRIVYAVSSGNLISFNSAAPATILSTTAITGLGGGETILGMDFRPATGQLYALGSASRLYTINIATGAATQVGSNGAFTLNGTKFGFDFNPTVDRIRVVSNADQNLRLNPIDGTLATADFTLAYAAADANAAANPSAGAAAYTNSFGGSTTTTLYVYDYNLQILAISNPPNNGTLNTVGSAGIAALDLGLDMDITSDQALGLNAAFLSASLTAAATNFYRINLSTGSAALIGTIGGGAAISAMAVFIPPSPPVKVVYALSSANNLVSFNSNTPGTILTSVPLTGITTGQVVEGLDFRPFNSLLYAVGYNASTGQTQVYTVNTTTGVATSVGAAVTLATNMGMLAVDFNPQADRIRVVGSTGQNYRLNPADGTISGTDTPLSYAVGDVRAGAAPTVQAAAYTNNFAGTTGTTLYYYDFRSDNLDSSIAPNTGVLSTKGFSGLTSTTSGVDLDITTNQSTGVNTGFFTANVSGTATNFYLVDLATGEARLVSTIGPGAGIVVSEMAVSFPDVTLPVTLTDFSVKKSGLTSDLSWGTKNELNNNYFIIERSADGRTFTSISDKINSKSADGTSSLPLNYSFTDFTPLKGINYYRLLQVDKDGNTKYSQVLTVTFDGLNEIKLYPNPAKEVVNINGYLSANTDMQVKVTDGSGKTVLLRTYKNQNGVWNTQLSLNRLQSGMYYVQISDGKNVIHTQTIYKD